MPVATVILVEPSGAANLGAVLRVAANFGLPSVRLVRPSVDLDDPDVAAWACGGGERVALSVHAGFDAAAGDCRLLAATVSGRGRSALPTITPAELAVLVAERGREATGLVFGNETSGLPRHLVDRADVAVRIPTEAGFPVLNLAQAVGILLAALATGTPPAATATPDLATQAEVAQLMDHLEETLLAIGFLDPTSPQRILRKLRRLFGRAGVTANELAILRGICRQVLWARQQPPERWSGGASRGPDD